MHKTFQDLDLYKFAELCSQIRRHCTQNTVRTSAKIRKLPGLFLLSPPLPKLLPCLDGSSLGPRTTLWGSCPRSKVNHSVPLYFYIFFFVNYYVAGTLYTKSFSYSSHSPMRQEEFPLFSGEERGRKLETRHWTSKGRSQNPTH